MTSSNCDVCGEPMDTSMYCRRCQETHVHPKQNKYYLLVYQWKRYTDNNASWEVENKLIARDPLSYLRNLRLNFSTDERGNKYAYVLLWYTEISRTQYELYKDEMN